VVSDLSGTDELARGVVNARVPELGVPPFDSNLLDGLLADRGIDVVLATSLHNVQYLLGGYRFFMYGLLDAIGLSRYLPVLVYPRERPDLALYVGAGNESWATDVEELWVGTVRNVAWSSAQAVTIAANWLTELGLDKATIGIERAYVPAEAFGALQVALPNAKFVWADEALEELRAVKSTSELELIASASTAVVDAMLATFAGARVGQAKAEIAERLRREETLRGLTFDYCLIAAGASLNRAPSRQRLAAGEVLSLDSGAHHHGYVADLARMGIAGEPTPQHDELLSEVDAVQQAARAIARAGTRGGDLFAAAGKAMSELPHRDTMSFLAHGCGLVTHEAPKLTATGSPPYPATHAELPLRERMVLSIETHVTCETVGFVKLEDTVIVREGRAEAVGDHGRGWNRIDA
jgi:Xaa-Pro aminopeptidase